MMQKYFKSEKAMQEYKNDKKAKMDNFMKRFVNIFNLIVFELLAIIGFAVIIWNSFVYFTIYVRTESWDFMKFAILNLVWMCFMTFVATALTIKTAFDINKSHRDKKI